MTLQEFVAMCRRRFGVIIVCTVIGTLLAGAYCLLATPRYTATATAYVQVDISDYAPASGQQNVAGIYYSASQLAVQKVDAFTPLFGSRAVAEKIRDRLGLEESAGEIAADISASSQVSGLTIDVSATADSPGRAQDIADTAVAVTAEQVRTLEDKSSPVRLVLMTSARLSDPARSPRPLLVLPLGCLVGVMVGVLVVILVSVLDTRIRRPEQLNAGRRHRVLATIPQRSAIARTSSRAVGVDYEPVRRLRTGLRYALVGSEARVVLVTSSVEGEGKSTVAQALARVLAMAGNDVLLVDTDMRKPTVAATFGVDGSVGLSQVLIGTADLSSAIQRTDVTGLSVLPAGEHTPYPSELLGSPELGELISAVRKHFVVVLDAPPLLPVTDASVITPLCDAVVMVVRAGVATAAQVDTSLELIEATGGRCAGFVLNDVRRSQNMEDGYNYSYYGRGRRRRSGAQHAGRRHGVSPRGQRRG